MTACPTCGSDRVTAWCLAHPAVCVTCSDDHATRGDQCSYCRVQSLIAQHQCPSACGGLTAEGVDATGLGAGYACRCHTRLPPVGTQLGLPL